MPIRPFLDGQAFNPEMIESMSKALAGACEALGLRQKPDLAIRIVATCIIDHARNGIHDPELLKVAAVCAFRQ